MNRFYKRFSAVTVVIAILISNAMIFTQASSNLLESIKGTSTINDLIEDDFCEFRVTQSDVCATKEKHNILNESIIIKNIDIPNGGWGYIGFSAEKTSEPAYNDIADGKLGLFIERSTNDGYTIRMNEDTVIGSLPIAEVYTISFEKSDGKYNLVVNGEVYENSEIDDFVKNQGNSVYVSLQGNIYFKGLLKISSLGWEFLQDQIKNQKKYLDVTGSMYIQMQEGSVVNTVEKHDWKTESLEIEDAVLTQDKQFYIVFNKIEKSEGKIFSTNNGDIVSLILTKLSDNTVSVDLYDGASKNLGSIPESPMYKFRYCLKDGVYGLYINDTFFTDSRLNLFMTSSTADSAEAAKSFVAIGSENALDFKVNIANINWQHNSDNKGSIISSTEDGFASITLNSETQAVVSPNKYNLLNHEIIIKNIDKIKNGKWAYIDLVKVLNKKGPSNATNEIITLAIKRSGKKYMLYAINSNNEKNSLSEFTSSTECRIKIVNINDSFYFSVNEKVCKNTNETVHSFLQNFIGSNSICMSYVGVSCNDNAKLDIKVQRYTPDIVELNGFKVSSEEGSYDAKGNDEDGYSVSGSGSTYAISAPGYNVSQKSLSAKIENVGGYLWFALSKTNKIGNALESGKADSVNKVVFLITPKNNNSQAQISYWNAYGKAEETLIETIDFDWSAKHTYDVRKGSDGMWYLAIDGKLISRTDSDILTAFMEKNANENLHFGIGGYTDFAADEISITEQISGDNTVVQSTEWKYFSDYGNGILEGDNDNGYSVSEPANYLYAFSEGKWDVTKKSVSIDLKNAQKLRFYLSTTDAVDTTVTPYGAAEDVNRIAFRLQPVLDKTRAQLIYDNVDGKGGSDYVTIIDFDWEGKHTFDIRQGSNGLWYLCIDNVLINGRGNNSMVNDFMNKHSKRLRFGIGGYDGAFEASGLKVINQGTANTNVGDDFWGYYNGVGLGASLGNNEEGYSIIFPNNATFSTSNLKYNIGKTAVSFKVEELNAWISFGVSATNYTDNKNLTSGEASSINRIEFLITPKLNATHAQFSYWNAAGKPGETVIKTLEFDWYGTEHTYDIRQNEDDQHWYLCIDGRTLMNSYSEVLDDFMSIHDGEDLYYTIGGIDAFGVSNLKVIDKPKVEELGPGSSGEEFDDVDVDDFEFDFSDDNLNFSDDDSNYSDEGNYDFGQDFDNFSQDFNDFKDVIENVEANDQKDPNEGMIQVKTTTRKLIRKGHGIIFSTFEKISMVLGAVVLVSGIVIAVVVLVRKKKRRSVK